MCPKMEPETMKFEVGRGLGGLGSDLGTKIALEAVLADFGRFGTGAGRPKWRQDGRTWRQDGPSWAPDRHLEASWGAILAILKGLGADFGKNGRHVKMSITIAFWPHFGVLGG